MTKPTSILIVDDDAPTRTVLRDLIRRTGDFDVHEAADGEAGVRAARTLRPDLILLDLMMPGTSGLEVCDTIRRDPDLRAVPILVLSAAEQGNATIAAIEAGADDFLPKPCNTAELRAKIATISRLNRFRALAHERERLQWLLDHSLEPVLVVDAIGAAVFANARAREVFGLPEGSGFDVVTALTRHFHAEPADALTQLQARGFKPGPGFALVQPESDYIGARWFDVELQAGDGAGELLLKFTDQTGRVRRDLETWSFQHMVFHKIRTPLNGLGTVLDIVSTSAGLAQDPDSRSLFEIARESAHRLEGTLLDVLKYHEALFHRGATPPAEGGVSALELLQSACRELGLSVAGVTADPDLQIERAVATTLGPVLLEICENYQKFSDAPTRGLQLKAAVQADGTLEIRCFAPGSTPPPEVIANLGRPYWQVQRQFTGEIPGMGLGLATARALLRSRGGDLRFAPCATEPGLVTILTVNAAALPVPA